MLAIFGSPHPGVEKLWAAAPAEASGGFLLVGDLL